VSGFYLDGKQELLARVIPQAAGVWIVGVNTDYDFNEGQTAYSLIEPFIILPAQELTSVTFTDGVLDADNPVWIAAGAGAAPEDNLELDRSRCLLRTGRRATLFAFIDSATVGLPQTLSGVNVTARIAANGLLKL
jgi:hypothetical protein